MLLTALKFYQRGESYINNFLQDLVLLIIRLYMADIFFSSGLVKFSNMRVTTLLFANEYKVPFLPPEFAAYLAMTTELTMPILLALGFLTRLAAIPVFIMTLVIQFTFLQLDLHYFWMICFGMLMAFGGGKISIDHWLSKFVHKNVK